ncbi:MAG TPA: porin [Myxococcota bacterium]|nr:porin [Myxococcota bacterium]
MLLLLLSSADAAETRPTVLAQVWATAYDQDETAQSDPAGYGDPEDDPGFKVRRARVGMDVVDDSGKLSAGVTVGYSAGSDAIVAYEGGVGLVEARASVQAHELVGVHAGLVKVPVGRETLTSSSALPFQERTVASNHLMPYREVGVLADFETAGLRLRAGAFNGNGSLRGDDDAGVLAAGRAEYTLGEGDPYRTFGSVDGFTLGVGGDFVFNPELATRTMVYGGDIVVRVKGLTAVVEYHQANITPTNTEAEAPGVLAATKRSGGHAQVGYTIADRWEPVARFEVFDEDASESNNGDLAHGTFGLTAHLMDDHLRLGGGYVMRRETGGRTVPNDTVRLWSQVAF